MTEKVFREESFFFYADKIDQLIPLNRWDSIDDKGRERGKSPRDKEWRTAIYTSASIEKAIEAGNNLGFRIKSNDFIVDMDPRNMEIEPQEAMLHLGSRFGLAVSEAPAVKTGSGGYHLYFQIPQEWVGKRFLNELPDLKGVEFKAEGRQVVAVGSKHPNGAHYEAMKGHSLKSIPAVSEKLLTMLEKPELNLEIEQQTIPPEMLHEMLSVLDPHDFSDNDSWLKMAMSCHSATGGEGLEVFTNWCIQDEEYSDHSEIIKDRWDSFRSSGITAGTLFRYVIDAGAGELIRPSAEVVFGEAELSEEDKDLIKNSIRITAQFERAKDGRPKRTVDNAKKAIQELGIVPRRNNLTQENYIEGSTLVLEHYFPEVATAVDDDLLHGVRAAITDRFRFEPSISQVSEAISALALLKPFHPIREYFNTLVWDGVDRVSDFFTRYCGTPGTPYTYAVGEAMLKAAVARVMKPGIKFDTMVILEGMQGCGKSSFVQILGGEWALEGLPNKSDLNHKDVIQQIQGHWLVEVEELAIMRKSDVDSLKAFLTRTTDKARFAYAREAKVYPRQCVFIGTTNDNEYLLDSTGNRRFLPIEVAQVNLQLLRLDRDQIWAQAIAMWNQQPTAQALMLSDSLWGDAADEQAARRISDPVEEKLAKILNAMPEDRDFVSYTDLLMSVLTKSPGEAEQKDVRRLSRAIQTIPNWKTDRKIIGEEPVKGVRRV